MFGSTNVPKHTDYTTNTLVFLEVPLSVWTCGEDASVKQDKIASLCVYFVIFVSSLSWTTTFPLMQQGFSSFLSFHFSMVSTFLILREPLILKTKMEIIKTILYILNKNKE